MRRREWDEEGDAMFVLGTLLGGSTSRVDPGGGATQLYDFDLVVGDVRVAVEVTRSVDESALATFGAVTKLDWTAPELSNVWHVGMRERFQVRGLRDLLVPGLRGLEAEGVESAVLRDPIEVGPALEARRQLFGAGVRVAYSLGLPSAGELPFIDVGEASRAGSTGFDLVVDAATAAACASDNRKKLAAAEGADERHVFVWVDSSRHALVAAVDIAADMPTLALGRAPQLPDEVDAVWLATAFMTTRIWRYAKPDGWSHFGNFELPPR